MADSDKNILITPNRGSSTDDPKIEFTGGDDNTVTLTTLDDGTLSFSGSSGQLFSIADSLTGTIFSVNDVSGIPSIEVEDDGTVRVAEFGGNLLVGTDVDNGQDKLQVAGSAMFSGAMPASRTERGVYIGLNSSGTDPQIQLQGAGANAPHIDFCNGTEDFDARIVLDGNDVLKFDGLNNTGLKVGTNSVFHDGYHPNADKWTTARTNTVTLTGDASGSGSASVNGTGNWTVSIPVVVNNDSHNHNHSDGGFTVNGNLNVTAGADIVSTASNPFRFQRSSNSQTGQDDNISVYVDDSNIYFTHNNDSDGDASGYNFRYMSGGAAQNLVNFSAGAFSYKGQNVFHDAYHPNADKWTTARTITLGGDLTGSVSIDGSANVTLSAQVANDSHSHSYLPLSGGTLTGGLTISGSLSRGTYPSLSQYHTGADNIVLKGNASGISSIFFESEKNGTNINHPSDFGFIQYHAYGTSTAGESNELIIGVSNDADDNVIINAPNVNGFKFRTGASATDYTVWHSGNFTPSSYATSGHSHSLTLSGDVSGSGSVSGTISVTVNNDSHSHSNYTPLDHFRHTGHGNYTSTTTSALLSEALGDDAFDSKLTAHKTGWSYSGNGDLTDAGRLRELAGTSWLWWTDNSSDNVQGNITGLCIAPNTGGSAGKAFIYNNQGSGYGPGWREIWTSTSDGSGSGLDADLLDGQHGSYYATANHNHTLTLSGDVSGSGSVSGTISVTVNDDSHSHSNYIASNANDSFSGTLTHSSQVALVPDSYGKGVFGIYSPTRYQHVWSMGSAYKTNTSGTSYGNMYGLTWTHTNVGTGTNQSISGLGHQLQLRMNGVLYCAFGSGIWTSGNITAYSDRAVKTNLEVIPNALDKVMQINGYTYDRTDYVEDPETGIMPDTRQAGVVAQEVEAILPEVVSGEEGNKAVAYGNMVALLIEAIKEQQTQLNELQAQIKSLKEK